MSVEASYENGILRLRCHGRYALEDFFDAFDNAIASEQFEPGSPLLIDLLESEETRTEPEMRRLSDFLAGRSYLVGRCAIVAATPFRYGLGRMLESFLEAAEMEFSAFNEISAALAWLKG